MSNVVRLALLAAVLGVALMAWSWRSPDRGGRATPTNASSQMCWREGDTQAYEFSLTVDAQIGGDEVRSSTVRQRYGGILHLRVYRVADEVLAGFQVQDMRIAIGDDRKQEKFGPLESLPFWVRFTRSGEIREITFHESAKPGTRDVLEEMLRSFVCIVPPNAGARWSTRETHSTGPFVAKYERAPKGRLRKTKTQYEREGVEILRSSGMFELSAESWLKSASLRDRTVIDSEAGARVSGTTTGRLKLTTGRKTPPAALRGSRAEAVLAMEHHRNAPEPERKKTKAETFTPADVNRTLLALNANDGAGAKSARRLARQIASDSKLIEMVLTRIEREGTTEGSAAAMVNALAMAGSVEAQAALAGILQGGEWRHENRRRAAIALGFVSQPSRKAMESLWRTSEQRGDERSKDLSNTALLALGTTTGTLQRNGSARVELNRTQLVARLGRASDQEERETVLKALGNTRDVSLADQVAHYLDRAEPGVRRASAYALRTMNTPSTADRLAARLEVETDIGVRQALSASLEKLDVSTSRALAIAHSQVAREKNESTRHALVELLARHMESVPGSWDTFKRLLRVETSSRIRKRIGTTLLAKAKSQGKNQ